MLTQSETSDSEGLDQVACSRGTDTRPGRVPAVTHPRRPGFVTSVTHHPRPPFEFSFEGKVYNL